MLKTHSSQEAEDRSRGGSIKHFMDLVAWQQGHRLVLLTYQLTTNFPKAETFGLTSQMRRAAVSVTSNIAEGFGRSSIKEKLHFYYIAHGSLVELENQFIIAKGVNFLETKTCHAVQVKLRELDKVLSGLLASTKRRLLTYNS